MKMIKHYKLSMSILHFIESVTCGDRAVMTPIGWRRRHSNNVLTENRLLQKIQIDTPISACVHKNSHYSIQFNSISGKPISIMVLNCFR